MDGMAIHLTMMDLIIIIALSDQPNYLCGNQDIDLCRMIQIGLQNMFNLIGMDT